MKKYILKFGLIFVTFTAVFIACEQEFFEGTDDSTMTVEEAQAWFEASQPEYLVLKSGGKEKKTKVAKPDWKGAFKSKNGKVEVVETHIITNGGFGFATKGAYDEWKATEHRGYMTSLTRLVVLKYKKTGEIVSFLMTIVGDKEYLEKKDFKMWKNTYLVKDKDFNGLVLFHSLEGAFVNGWRLDEGKPTAIVNPVESSNLPIRLKSTTCQTITVYETTYYYTDWYVNGEFDHTQYNGSTTTTLYEYEQCYDDNIDDDGGGGIDPNYVNKLPNDPDDCFSGSPNEIQVYFWKKTSSGDVGHTAIRAGNTIYGYYPTDVNGDGVYSIEDLNNSPGEMHIDDLNSFLGSTGYSNSTVNSYTLAVNSNQRALLLLAIDYYTQNPGTYSLLGQNCTTVAADCLNSIGFSFNGGFPNALEMNISQYNSDLVLSNCTFDVP